MCRSCFKKLWFRLYGDGSEILIGDDDGSDSTIKLQMVVMPAEPCAPKHLHHQSAQQSIEESEARAKQRQIFMQSLQSAVRLQSEDIPRERKNPQKFATNKQLYRIHTELEDMKTFALQDSSFFSAFLRQEIFSFNTVMYKKWQGICLKEYVNEFFCFDKGFLGLTINSKDRFLPTIENYTNIMAWDLWRLNDDGVFEVISMWLNIDEIPMQWALESLDFTFKPGVGMIGLADFCDHWESTVALGDNRKFMRYMIANQCGIQSGDAFKFTRGGDTFVMGYYSRHTKIQNCHYLKERLTVIE